MTKNAKLTTEQSQIIRELQKNVDGFFSGNILSSAEGVRGKHWEVVSKFIELQMEFPEFAKKATTFWEAEIPDEIAEMPGYGDALFSLLVTLRSFSVAESLTGFVGLYGDLYNSIFDLATFSDEFDAERGFWKEELLNV